MPSWLINLLTGVLIMSLIVVLIHIGPSTSVLDDDRSLQTNTADQHFGSLSPSTTQQIIHRQTDWNELNQTTRTIIKNEIENLKRLFQFTATAATHNTAADHLRNLTKTLDSLFVSADTPNNQQQQQINNTAAGISIIDHQIKILQQQHQAQQQQPTKKLLDLNALLFLGLMLLILVLITLYLLNSWSTRLVRRASIQTKTADNHKQPYTISV